MKALALIIFIVAACGSSDNPAADAGPAPAADAGPPCPIGLTLCGGDCVNTDSDNLHCGDCDQACEPGTACDGAGTCAITCQPGLLDCGAGCIDPDRDADHCGATGDCTGDDAGETCTGAQECLDGACVEIERVVRSCAAIRGTTMDRGDGLYVIWPDGAGSAVPVWCDQTTDGGGWTLVYQVRNDVAASGNLWWPEQLAGGSAAPPGEPDQPLTSSRGPSLAARAELVADLGASQWRATLHDPDDGIVVDLVSSYTGADGRGLRCFATGECSDIEQGCSPADAGTLLVDAVGGNPAGTGVYLCDIGDVECPTCVDWAEVNTDGNLAGATSVEYAGDDSIGRPDTWTSFWVR